MPSTKEVILFDIDGTLITSGGAGSRAWSLAYESIYGKAVDIGHLADEGMTDPEVCRRSFEAAMGREPDDREAQLLLEKHLSFLSQCVQESEGYSVMDGTELLLVELIQKGFLLGLVSGNSERGAHVKLKRAGLNRFFSFGGYGSDSSDRTDLTRAALARAEIIYGGPLNRSQFLAVGDTPRDVNAAHAVGIECVGVATRKFSVSDLAQANADYVIGSFVEGLPV